MLGIIHIVLFNNIHFKKLHKTYIMDTKIFFIISNNLDIGFIKINTIQLKIG
jgi:hypothetical protein